MKAHLRVLSACLAASMTFSSVAVAADDASPPYDTVEPAAVVSLGNGANEADAGGEPASGNGVEPAAAPASGSGGMSAAERDMPAESTSGVKTAGEIEVAVRLDYDQSPQALTDRQVKAVLKDKNGSEQSFDLGDWKEPGNAGPSDRVRTVKNGISMIDLHFGNLARGETYTLTLSGRGYTTFEAELTMDYCKYVLVGTGDGTFSLGNLTDANGSADVVDEADREAIAAALQNPTPAAEDIRQYDLDGDGRIDIVDLAYVNHNLGLEPVDPAECILDTYLIASSDDKVSFGEGDKGTIVLDENGNEIAVTLDDLMNQEVVTNLRRKEEGVRIGQSTPVSVTVQFAEESGVDMEQLNIITEEGSGRICDGAVTIYYDDANGRETSEEIPFTDEARSVSLLDADGAAKKTITIQLGRRVAVKRVTITVTRTESGDYASVASIEFLKDIVPENPLPANSAVRNLTATPGSEAVTLKWSALPNVSGYEVKCYETATPEKIESTQIVTTTVATVSGLKNNHEYTFEVTPVDESSGWRGETVSITATPEAAQAPAKVDMVSVSEGDGYLDISWKEGQNATSYSVYYTSDANAAPSDYLPAAEHITSASTRIEGLTNDTTYYIYVTASNDVGTGPISNIVSGTPRAVVYERPVGIPTEGVLPRSKIAGIRLLDPNNVGPSSTANFTADYLIDDDYSTQWTTKNWYGNEHVEVTFTEPVSLSAAIWVPRLDGTYANNLRVYAVRVSTDEAHGGLDNALIVPDPVSGGYDDGAPSWSRDMDTWPSVRGNPGTNKFGVLPFGPIEGVTKIQVAVEQQAYTAISLSELMFLEYDPENDVPSKIDALFKNASFTELNDGVTEAQIAEIEALLNERTNYYLSPETYRDELALARELLSGQGTSGAYLDGLHSTAGKKNYGQGGSLLQPLGVSAAAGTPKNPGDTITVYADIPAGAKVELVATQVNAEASKWQQSLGELVPGRNVITVPKIGSQAANSGGSLYYRYSGEQGSQIRLHIRRAVKIPVLDVVEWYAMEEAERNARISSYLAELKSYITAQSLSGADASNTRNVTEISMPSVLLSIPATAVQNATEASLRSSILAWEDLLHICRYTQGIDHTYEKNDMAYRENIRCMQMFEGAFMYAAGAHIGIGAGSCAGMVSGAPISTLAGAAANSLFGWGIAHEIGHNMDKLGKAEITNNIYAIMAQTYDGRDNTLPSRLENSGKYAGAFRKAAQQYPGASNDVFVQLAMYWQLHLAYDEGLEDGDPMHFYHEFFSRLKSGECSEYAYDDKVAVLASRVANRNLTEFFTRWGMVLSDAAKEEMGSLPDETRAVWYLNDQSRRDRLSGVAGASGAVSLAVGQKRDTTGAVSKTDVELRITPSITGRLQGYEIIRDGRSIDFLISDGSEEVVYTDSIGTANHRVFEYQVVAYDTLGSEVCRSNDRNQIRIAYDMTVPETDYQVTKSADGSTWTFTVNEAAVAEMQVSGVKVNGYSQPMADITVKVTCLKDGTEEAYIARKGNVANQAVDDADSFVAYLQKPLAAEDDTRIWTYDAKKVEISGIPTDIEGLDVQLISYAGDDVAFLEADGTTAIGILQERYYLTDDHTSEDPADFIEKGSLVVVGTFRGDPVYNYAKLVGQFTITPNSDEAEGTDGVTVVERDIAGQSIVFSTVPEDEQVSDCSDGMFLFIPNVQEESKLQFGEGEGAASNCSGINLLPSRMKVELYRSDTPNSAEGGRITAETVWIDSPGGEEIPYVILQSEVAP